MAKRMLVALFAIIMVFTVCAIPAFADTLSDFAALTYSNEDLYGETTMPYRLYVPKDYDETKSYPMILFMHGAGERGNTNNHLNTTCPFTRLLTSNNLKNYPCIIVAPQCPADVKWVDTDWTQGSYDIDALDVTLPMQMALSIADKVRTEYNIDANRNYIMGVSMGGYATWNIIERFPNTFAAAIPMCGAGDTSKAALIKDMPIWAFHGDADPTVPVDGSRDMVNAIQAAGGTKIKYTEYPDVVHNCWLNAYAEPDFFGWLFEQTKSAKSANKMYADEQFSSDNAALTSDGWTLSNYGDGSISAQNGTLTLQSAGGSLPNSNTIVRSGNLMPLTTIGADLDEAIDNNWKITDTVDGLSVADGVMTFEPQSAALTQAINTFGTALEQTFVSEFSVRLTYEEGTSGNFGVQIYNGKYRTYLQIAATTVKIQQFKGSNSFVTCNNASESGAWYNYYVSQTAGHVTVLRKAATEKTWTVLGSNLPIPAMTGNAAFKAYISTVGLKCDIKDIQVNKAATSPIDDILSYRSLTAINDSFDDATVAASDWATPSKAITIDTEVKNLHITAGGVTAAQSITKDIPDFGKSVIDLKYCINATTAAGSKSLSVAVMNKTNRGVITIFPNQMTMRGAAGNNWYTISNVASAVGSDTWYDLRMVMELYDADTNDYRYSVYRKLTTDSEYVCLANRIPMPAFTSTRSYINLFVETDSAADVSVDDVNITPYESLGKIVDAQMVSYAAVPESSYCALFNASLGSALSSTSAEFTNGGYHAQINISGDKITLNNPLGEAQEYSVETDADTWYTYLLNVKNFGYADLYRKSASETSFTKIINNQALEAYEGLCGVKFYVDNTAAQSAVFDDVRIFKGIVANNQSLVSGSTPTVTIPEGTLKATASVASGAISQGINAKAYLALYNSRGVIQSVTEKDYTIAPLAVSQIEISKETEAVSGGYAKLYLWDNENKLQPIVQIDDFE